MDPLGDPLEGDPGKLSAAIDGLTGAVKSAEGLADAVNDATSFELVVPIFWALIVLVAASRFVKPWNDGAAKRWTDTGRILDRKTAAQYEAELAELRRQLRDVTAQRDAALAVPTAVPTRPVLVATSKGD